MCDNDDNNRMPSMEEILKMRNNPKVYREFCIRLLQPTCLPQHRDWVLKCKIGLFELEELASEHDEAYALLEVENNYHHWVAEHKDQTEIDKIEMIRHCKERTRGNGNRNEPSSTPRNCTHPFV